MCPNAGQKLSEQRKMGRCTSGTVSGESDRLDYQVTLASVADQIVENFVSLLKLKGKLFLRRGCVLREHYRSSRSPG